MRVIDLIELLNGYDETINVTVEVPGDEDNDGGRAEILSVARSQGPAGDTVALLVIAPPV